MLSYFIIIRTLLKTFAGLSICFLPLIFIYSKWDTQKENFTTSWIDKTTLSNLGESTSRCVSDKLVNENVLLGCEAGIISEITSLGVYAFGSEALK